MAHIHDPREFVRGLQQILVSDAKRIGVLAGAGTSMIQQRPNGKSLIMGTVEMTSSICAEMKNKYGVTIAAIKKELTDENKKIHIESIISKISQKELVVGSEKLCGLKRNQFQELRAEIEKMIQKIVSIQDEADFKNWNIAHYQFARWVNDATRKNSVEIFTTNYDYLFELSFEKFDIPYFDGFVGSYEPFFHSGLVEDDYSMNGWIKLWKIHGSLGWKYNENEKKIIKGNKDAAGIVVYPSILKYDKSKKQPFVSYLDRLVRFIKHDDSVVFVCGYAFGDDHINDAILNGLSKAKTSCVIAFLFDDFDEGDEIAELAKNQTRLSIYGKRNAVIGGKFGQWKLKSIPSDEELDLLDTYFTRDLVDIIDNTGKIIGRRPDLAGDFKLVDFVHFVSFLSELNYLNHKSLHAK